MHWLRYLSQGISAYQIIYIFRTINQSLETKHFLLSLQKCPFEAIQIINLPRDLEKDTTHRYGANTFKLHRFAYLLQFPFRKLIPLLVL